MGPILNIKDLMGTKYPEQKWLVEGLIPANGITILSAEPNSYKTYMLLETALAVAQGRPLFGQFETTKMNVLMIDMENGEALLQQRLKQLGAGNEEQPIYFTSRSEFQLNEDTIKYLLINREIYKFDLLMIDSLVRVHRSDENSAGDMAEVFEMLRRLVDKGMTVLITHHNRKPGSSGKSARHDMRGSSDILAAVDCHIGIRRKDDKVMVEQTKLRIAKELSPFTLNVEGDDRSVRFNFAGSLAPIVSNDKLVEVAILSYVSDDQHSQQEILAHLETEGLKTNEHKVREILAELIERGAIFVRKGKGNTKYYTAEEEDGDDLS